MNRPRATRVAAGAAATVLCLSVVVVGSAASAPSGCSDYLTYDVLGSAQGVRTTRTVPGNLIVTNADANLAAAQAKFHSIEGSIGWAGAAYSSQAAENVGNATLTANDLPLTVVSSYPADPDPAPKSAGAATVKAQSGPDSSTATAAEGGSSSESGSTGHADASTSASCGADGSLAAVADNSAEVLSIAGVLGIGSVKSHAKAIIDAQGQTHFEATMDVGGVTVLGQRAAITDKGEVVGSSVIPLPANPFAKPLGDAGVTIEYIAAVEDPQTGEVFAPGLNIVVTRDVPGVGHDSTSYLVGRAYARSTLSAAAPAAPAPPAISPSFPTRAAPAKVAASPTAAVPAATPARHAAAPVQQASAASRIAAWSIAAAYRALAVGVALLLAVRLLSDKIAVRLRWR